MAVDPSMQDILRSGTGAPPERGDFTAWQRDQQALEMAKRAAEQADAAELGRRDDQFAQQQVVNYTDEPLSEDEWLRNQPVIGEVAPPQPTAPSSGVIDVSTPELAEQVRAMGATGQRLGAVPQVADRTVQGPRIVTIMSDLRGFVYGDEEYDFLAGRQYKVPAHIADHLVRKRVAY